MHTLRNWRAKRAGGRITVYGLNDRDEPQKVVGVDVIEAVGDKVMAKDKNGNSYRLAL